MEYIQDETLIFTITIPSSY